jgi:hypothetical protein
VKVARIIMNEMPLYFIGKGKGGTRHSREGWKGGRGTGGGRGGPWDYRKKRV